jgi:hypothetical protein
MSEQPQDWASESRETNAYQHSTAARTDFRDIAKTCLQNLDTIQQLREQLAAEREKSEAQKLRAEMLEAQRNDARKQLAAERDRAELIRTWWKQEIENRKLLVETIEYHNTALAAAYKQGSDDREAMIVRQTLLETKKGGETLNEQS